MLGHNFETKTPATNRTSQCGGTTSKTPATNRTSQGWGTTSRQRHPKQIIHLNTGASLRDQDASNKFHIFVLGHHCETKTPSTKRSSLCWGLTSRPRHRQQIVHLSAGAPLRDQDTVHLSAGAPLRDQDTGNKVYILVLVHHFEIKTPATNCTS